MHNQGTNRSEFRILCFQLRLGRLFLLGIRMFLLHFYSPEIGTYKNIDQSIFPLFCPHQCEGIEPFAKLHQLSCLQDLSCYSKS